MNVSSCRRCAESQFFRVRHMVDLAGYERRWGDRPVRVENGHAVGHFETWVCRGCGFTDWWARDWQPPVAPTFEERCVECGTSAPTAVLLGLELVVGRPRGPTSPAALMPYVTGLSVGLRVDGMLQTKICTRCDHVVWRGLVPENLDPNRTDAHYRFADDPDRHCLVCGQHACLFEDDVHDLDRTRVCVAYEKRSQLEDELQVAMPQGHGRFQLRVCAPCGSIEWYARDLEGVAACEGVEVVSPTSLVRSTPHAMGPYR